MVKARSLEGVESHQVEDNKVDLQNTDKEAKVDLMNTDRASEHEDTIGSI